MPRKKNRCYITVIDVDHKITARCGLMYCLTKTDCCYSDAEGVDQCSHFKGGCTNILARAEVVKMLVEKLCRAFKVRI